MGGRNFEMDIIIVTEGRAGILPEIERRCEGDGKQLSRSEVTMTVEGAKV